MDPLVLRKQDRLQLTYELFHRPYSTKVYPVQSPNGSTIILYGHSEGIRIIWRGGKPFKTTLSTKKAIESNGKDIDDVMVVDLDDDEPGSSQTPHTSTEFADEEDEIDPSEPYQKVLRYIDIYIGSTVRQIAIPHVPANIAQTPPGAYPGMLSRRMVVVVACDDLSLRILSLPLSPPPPDSNDASTWDVQNLKLYASSIHQDFISGVSITHSINLSQPDEGNENSNPHSRSRGHGGPGNTLKSDKDWCFLVAAVSTTAGGLLSVHQISLTSDGKLSTHADGQLLLQRQLIRSSLANPKVKFNPSAYPSERHSNLIITCADAGCVKVFQVYPSMSVALSRERRGSGATIDSATSSSRSHLTSRGSQGRVLLTMYAGFIESSDLVSSTRRKRILDAEWVASGRAVLALLQDGEWGIWDVEGSGPAASATSQSLFKGQGSVSGIHGGALTRFALRGFVKSGAEEVAMAQKLAPKALKQDTLAPMTPHTRKIRSSKLFQGSSSPLASAVGSDGSVHGSISVTDHIASRSTSTLSNFNESILISYGDANIFIPSLMSFWRAEITGRGSLEASGKLRPSPIISPQLGGEWHRGIVTLPLESTESSFEPAIFGSGAAPDVVITTDTRLIMLVSPISEHSTAEAKGSAVASSKNIDQLLLTQGDLDIEGMGRVLDGMANEPSVFPATLGENVDFALDEDGDVGMSTPTPKANSQPRRRRGTPAASRGGGRKTTQMFT